MFTSQRVNDIVHIESGDGRIKLTYPYSMHSIVKTLVESTVVTLPENEPQLVVGAPFASAVLVERAPKQPKKHKVAKVLKDAKGIEFKLADMIEDKIKSSKNHKLPLAEAIESVKHHYAGNVHHAKNAIRISAMKSARFSIANDNLVLRGPSQLGTKKLGGE